MLTGKIIKVMEANKYGFIKCDDNGLEYFYHFSMLSRVPKIGEQVAFEVSEQKDRGPRCKTVEFLK